MALLRYLMVLSLIVWIGGIVFFAAVVTRAAFSVLPTHHLAGNIVNRTLASLHWMGIVSDLLASSRWLCPPAGVAAHSDMRHAPAYPNIAIRCLSKDG